METSDLSLQPVPPSDFKEWTGRGYNFDDCTEGYFVNDANGCLLGHAKRNGSWFWETEDGCYFCGAPTLYELLEKLIQN